WWALLDSSLPLVWMQRDAALLAVLMAATVLYRLGLARWLTGSIWSTPSRSLAAVLGAASVAAAAFLLGQELMSYDALGARRTPLRIELTVCSGLALLAMSVLAIHSALTKDTDDLGIEGERRSVYVYIGELLA